VGGLALGLSLPPFGWWVLAPGGAAVLFWRLRGLRVPARLLGGWAAGLGCFGIGLWWAGSFNWYGAVVLIALQAATMAVAAALVPAHRGRLPAFIGAFTLLEALRDRWPFGGLPLGGIALGQAAGPFLAAARLGGPLLLTAGVWSAGGALGSIAELTFTNSRADRRRGWAGVVPGLATLLALGMVLVIADRAPDGGTPRRTLDVAAVQGGGRRGLSKAEVPPSTVFAAQVAATTTLEHPAHRHDPPAPRLVVWPEDVISLSGQLSGSPSAEVVSGLARRLRATVVAGVTVTVSDRAFRNEAVAWSPRGKIVGSVEKVHRVPFGEYVPDRGFFSHLANLSAVPLDAVPGRGNELLRTPAGPLGILVSYEVFYADRSRSSVRAGAELLVVPTNTTSYASDQVPAQELAADRIQAVETGRALVQAAPTGYSSIVDQRGRLVRDSTLGRRSVVQGVVGMRTGLTLYTRFGDWPVLAAAALALCAGLAAALARRATRSTPNGCRRRGSPPPRTSRDSRDRPPSPAADQTRTDVTGAPHRA
jgi:apolipoprotein N-acyltransferase